MKRPGMWVDIAIIVIVSAIGMSLLARQFHIVAPPSPSPSGTSMKRAKAQAAVDDIFEALMSLHLEKFHKIIKEHPEQVHARDKWGSTPLHRAAEIGLLKEVKLLVVNGADINAKDKRGETPLFGACASGSKEIAELLISKGADVNVKSYKRLSTPLRYTTFPDNERLAKGRRDVAAVLISHGADVNAKDSDGQTALHDASVYGFYDLAKLLVSNGARVDIRDNDGNTPLFCFWYGENDITRIAKLLLDSGADVNARNKKGKTVLKDAIDEGKPKSLINFLRKHGAKE